MKDLIYLAPLQGFTDFIYRKIYADVFGSIDAFFIPYISLKNKELLPKYKIEIKPENNLQNRVVPQVLAGNSDELLFLAEIIKDLGFSEINLNLGCPYPMVTNRKKGSGLLPFPEEIKKLLVPFFEKSDLKLSVKMRTGLNKPDEIENVLPVLNELPVSEIILHPRIAKQLYKGEILSENFFYFTQNSKHKKVYNGDIHSVESFEKTKLQFPEIDTWMLGRGILMNPFLPSEINGKTIPASEKKKMLETFHLRIFEEYSEKMDNPGNVLNKMKQFWIYFSLVFSENEKVFKRIKKAGSIQVYKSEVAQIFKRI